MAGEYRTKDAAPALNWAQANEAALMDKWNELNDRDNQS